MCCIIIRHHSIITDIRWQVIHKTAIRWQVFPLPSADGNGINITVCEDCVKSQQYYETFLIQPQ